MTTAAAILSVRENIRETRDAVDKYGVGPPDSGILALVDCATLERLCALAENADTLRAELEQLKRGEFICRKCGLRKDGEECRRT